MKSFLTVFSLGIALGLAGNAYAADTWYGECTSFPNDADVWSEANNWADACAAGSVPGNVAVDILASNDNVGDPICIYDLTSNGRDLTTVNVTADSTSEMTFQVSSSATATFSIDTLVFTGNSSSNPAIFDYDVDKLTVDTSTTVLKEVVFDVAACVLFQPNDLIVGVSDNSDYGDLTLNGTGDLRPGEVEIHAKSTGNPSYIRGGGTILVTDG